MTQHNCGSRLLQPLVSVTKIGTQMQSVVQLDCDSEAKFGGTLVEVSNPVPTEPQTPMDADKASIYRHPLFPLLALLFEKCEQSTLSSECITSASFDVDIENFVRSQEKEGKPFFSEDPELDNLVSSTFVNLWQFWQSILFHNEMQMFVALSFHLIQLHFI
uniref:MEIS N-terminal domain-containing protein n=1 Tax=Fundulus heteroclitus TaxID=8078 RepID=A0A3Q2PCL6_FUNHE